jgi:hypothetical protein
LSTHFHSFDFLNITQSIELVNQIETIFNIYLLLDWNYQIFAETNGKRRRRKKKNGGGYVDLFFLLEVGVPVVLCWCHDDPAAFVRLPDGPD